MSPNTKSNKRTLKVVYKAIKNYVLTAVGFVLVILPLISVLVDMQLILIKHSTRIENGSEVYQLLQQEFPGAFVHVYVFNVTNADAFTSGEDHKLKLQEVGPFIYQEYRRNEQFELDEEAGVMRYTPHMWTKFIPEGSVGDPHLINVTVPNMALLAMASMLSDKPFFTKAAFNILVGRLGSTALVNLDVHSHLWGYKEPLITFGNTVLPGWITFSKMGILDRFYDQSAVPRFELGATSEDKFRIKTLDGVRGLSAWDYENPSKRTRCNSLEDTYEGISYPPGLTTNTPLRMYRNVLCRMLNLDFVGTRTLDYGPKAFVYKFSNDTFRIGPATECLCGQNGCRNGISDLSPCLYGLPLVLSQAHFLDADPELYERVEGIHPSEEEHGSEFLVDPKIGLVLKTYFALQISVDVQNVKFISAARPFSDMIVPVAYFKIIQGDVPEETKESLRSYYFRIFYIIRGIEMCSFVLGLLILIYVAKKIYWSVVRSRSIGFQISKKNNVVHIEEPLMNEKGFGQIRVLESEN